MTVNYNEANIAQLFITTKAFNIYNKIIEKNNNTLIKHLIWMLTHLCIDYIEIRNYIIQSNIIYNVLDLYDLGIHHNHSLLDYIIWMLSVINKGSPYPPSEIVFYYNNYI
jgi:hypothetical protein